MVPGRARMRVVSETLEGRTRIGAYARCVDGERVLLVRLSADEAAAGCWTLPGGGLDFGERPDAAVLRELTEETGLVGEVEGLLRVDSFAWPAGASPGGVPFHGIFVVYAVRIAGGELRDEASGSTDRAAWLASDELASVPLTRIARAVLGREIPAPPVLPGVVVATGEAGGSD
jgi:ADP-ribose pyrophosphatase YjhB (NUDIX family)